MRKLPASERRPSGEPVDGPDFATRVAEDARGPLTRGLVETLQVNLTARCNLACHHCHVGSGPNRTEALSRRDVERVLDLLARSPGVEVLDLTGGAPELHPDFRRLVEGARALGRRVLDRCNLTVLLEPGQEATAAFLAAHQVEIVASLPCYTAENVERQRGRGVFGRSIEALQRLSALGYGEPRTGLRLDLVYNPTGPDLPPPQEELEARYREELRQLFGIEFTRLVCITNMPIQRFAHDLERAGQRHRYQQLLERSFNPDTVPHLMCRSLVSVGWDGRLHDCDFNQQLDVQPAPAAGRPGTIWDVDRLETLRGLPIATDRHCFGCTAGRGSSCSGTLAGIH